MKVEINLQLKVKDIIALKKKKTKKELTLSQIKLQLAT